MFHETSDLFSDEIILILKRTSVAQPDKHWLSAYYFDICLIDGTIIGACDLRIGHNERTYIGGNIGYSINESFRGYQYAAKACHLLFHQARKHGMIYLIITCDPSNIASSKTCLYAGCQLLEIATIPEHHDMYAQGKRHVMVYRFNL